MIKLSEGGSGGAINRSSKQDEASQDNNSFTSSSDDSDEDSGIDSEEEKEMEDANIKRLNDIMGRFKQSVTDMKDNKKVNAMVNGSLESQESEDE